MVHIKTVLAATCAFLKKILQLAQRSKSNVLYIKRNFVSLVSNRKRINAFGVLWRELWSNEWAKIRAAENTKNNVFKLCYGNFGFGFV